MAKKVWEGTTNAKYSTGANWEGGTVPAISSEVECVSTKNNPFEINATAGKGKSVEFQAGYTAAVTSTAGAVWKIGTTTTTGVALKILAETKFEVNGSMTFEFVSESGTTATITTGGHAVPKMLFIGEGGKWQLADAMTANTVEVARGTLETNGQTVAVSNSFVVTGALARTVKLAASKIEVNGGKWEAGTTTNLTWDAGTSTIELLSGSTGEFIGGGLKYNNLTIAKVEESKITGANTFAALAINNKEATAKKGCKLESTVKQTLTGLTSNGASGKLARLESTTEGSRHKISKAAGTVELKYTYIQDSEAEGGATFIAGEGCVDGGNNVGWSFGIPVTGKATGAMLLTGTSKGLAVQVVTGKATGPILLTGTAKGAIAEVLKGKATGPVLLTGLAKSQTAEVLKGKATGPVLLTGTSTGEVAGIRFGKATGAMRLTGTARGQSGPLFGNATGRLRLTGTSKGRAEEEAATRRTVIFIFDE